MRRAALLLWLVVGFMAGLTAGAQAQDLPPGVSAADQAAIQGVIRGQLDAFGRDDAAGAYAFAAPGIMRQFPSADVFLDMVRRAYPPVYRSRQAQFGELRLQDGELVQGVELVGPDGTPMLALYGMEREADGTWRIASCALMRSTRLGV